MTKIRIAQTWSTWFALMLLMLGLVLAPRAANADSDKHDRDFAPNPMIFVHGASGSGAQFESQAMRFTSNGYPQDHIAVVEYDSGTLDVTKPADLAIIHAAIDARVAELQAATGKAKVDILGHSRGTTVMHAYLASPARAANVGHYVNIDGRTAAAPPGGVPTLAIWGGVGPPVRQIVGALNVTFPQTHVQVATSKESFGEMFRFFTGTEAQTSDIKPAHLPFFPVSGRAVNFPANTGVDGATVAVWEVRAETGERKRGRSNRPDASFVIGADGNWGPFLARRGAYYEFTVTRAGGDRSQHLFYEPFLRSDRLVRLNTTPPGTGLDLIVQRSENHSALTIVRNKEFLGDQGANSDVLKINGVNVVNPLTADSTFPATIAMFAYDVGSDGVSNVATPIPILAALPFLSGVDLFIPSNPPGTVSVEVTPRGNVGATRTINVRNIPSSQAGITVQINDFEQ